MAHRPDPLEHFAASQSTGYARAVVCGVPILKHRENLGMAIPDSMGKQSCRIPTMTPTHTMMTLMEISLMMPMELYS
jgi:hypothetical protein